MMLQEIMPHVYSNEACFEPPRQEDTAVFFHEGKLAMRLSDETIHLPKVGEYPGMRWQYLFRIDETRYYLALDEARQPSEMQWIAQRSCMEFAPVHEVMACSVAGSLARWYADNRYCGTCGGMLLPSETERALSCPHCGRIVYPKICPSVIVAVADGDRLLLTRYAGRTFRRWALVAGFAEIGESIEDTVRREVKEEVGLCVRDLHFFASQPWGFTDTLLFGFFCHLDGSPEISLQEEELSEARWFSREELPTDHSTLSLTGNMIEYFRSGAPIW